MSQSDFDVDQFIKDMQAFEKKYPGVVLIMEMVEVEEQDMWRVELNDNEVLFDNYEEALLYLNIYE